MDIDSCFELGYVIKPHGLKGDVSILIDADDPNVYKDLESVFVLEDNLLVPFFISQIRISGNKAILSFEEITTVDAATSFKGKKLYLPLDRLPKLSGNQFYYHEIVDFMVHDKLMGEVGKVTSVYDTGLQHLLVIDHKGSEVLLPIADATIAEVDKTNKVFYVNFPNGLLDIYKSEESHED